MKLPHLYFTLGVKKTPVIHSPSLQAGPVGAWCVFNPGNHKDPTIWLKRKFIQKTTSLSGQSAERCKIPTIGCVATCSRAQDSKGVF